MVVIKKDIQSYILAIDPSKMYGCTSFFMAIKRPAWNAQRLVSVLSPLSNPTLLDLPRANFGIIKTSNHNHGNATSLSQRYVRPFMSSKSDKKQFSSNIVDTYSREKATRNVLS